MYYRLVDWRWEPYATGYNDTDLRQLAYSIFSLWDWDWMWDDEVFYWKTNEDIVNKIYSFLKKWDRDLAYIVEEQETPFDEEDNPSHFIYWPY